MRRALQLARQGQGRVEPNPMVGCVLTKGGRMIGEGFHRRFGGPHAEVYALRQAGDAARGASAFVTLEPCNFTGKTPPCVDALIHAGIASVVAAVRDPNPKVAGRGLGKLRRAGIRVQVGLLREEAGALIAPYTKLMTQRQPFVIAKWAQSLDGKIATRSGASKWISSPESRRLVHGLRARVDAIVVGSGTVLRDDPQLTCRSVTPKRVATRVILDTRLRTPVTSRVVRTARRIPTLIFTTSRHCSSRRARRLRAAGVALQAVALTRGQVSIKRAFRHLAQLQMTNVLIEGGGQVLGAAFDAGMLDEIYAFVSPRLIGGAQAPDALAGRGLADLRTGTAPRILSIRPSGGDMLYHLGL